eukprot:CAMPEP_0194550094 /NCGR_PEP_ID=MMETSP0253-20130528/95539_1 /TAXON_ID=2966 /ORGANISM="Noctiluca scintillans" /LENGTH=82 /DNA_ID=CAMNT_0039397529 /DNA_START=282 /DNA_END=531 /DNA_ORIENTATION=-
MIQRARPTMGKQMHARHPTAYTTQPMHDPFWSSSSKDTAGNGGADAWCTNCWLPAAAYTAALAAVEAGGAKLASTKATGTGV